MTHRQEEEVKSPQALQACHAVICIHRCLVITGTVLRGSQKTRAIRDVRGSQLRQRQERLPILDNIRAANADHDDGRRIHRAGRIYELPDHALARVAIGIQLAARKPRHDVLKAGPLELDRSRCKVFLNGDPVNLTATEFRLLEHLMSSPGQVFNRDRLLDAVWGQQRSVLERTVDAYVVRLRNKLEADPENPRFIQSLRGIGYSFCETVS